MLNHENLNRIIAIINDDDDLSLALRILLIDHDAAHDPRDPFDLPADAYAIVRPLMPLIDAMPRESLTDLLLMHSLCPLHRIDYAICFDDDDPDCAPIRDIHPMHDT